LEKGFKEFTRDNLPLVSVVINFYNEAENIHMAPRSLSKQTYTNFEVILVDDCSTDQTANLILANYGNKLQKVVLLRNDKSLGLRPSRNIGVKHASGEIIVTLDLHTLFDCNFIARIVSVFVNDAKIGAVGSLIMDEGEKWFQRGMRALSVCLFSIRKKIKQYNYVFGTAAAYKAKALNEIGYLSENEIVEDTDASWKLSKNGWRVITDENNVIFHKSPYQSFRGFLSRIFISGLRASHLLLQYPRKFFYPQFFLRLIILPVISLLLYLDITFFSLLLIAYFLGLTLCLKFFHQKTLDSVSGTIVAFLLTFISSFGLLYGLVKKLKKTNFSKYD
jgi:glycosyltransferase involved in cell wall biosynthesis